MRLSLGPPAVATGKPSLGMLLGQVVEDRAGLLKKPAVVLAKCRHSARGIHSEKLLGAILDLDCLVRRSDPLKRNVGRKRTGTYGIVRVGIIPLLFFSFEAASRQQRRSFSTSTPAQECDL